MLTLWSNTSKIIAIKIFSIKTLLFLSSMCCVLQCCTGEKKRKKDREWESVCVQSSYFLTFSAFFLSPSQMCSEAPERTQTALNDFSVCSFSCSRRHSLSLFVSGDGGVLSTNAAVISRVHVVVVVVSRRWAHAAATTATTTSTAT